MDQYFEMQGAALETRDEAMVEFMTHNMDMPRAKNFLDYMSMLES